MCTILSHITCVLHCVFIAQSQIPSYHCVVDPLYPLLMPPLPFPSGTPCCCLCLQVLFVLFIHLLLSVLHPTYEWNYTLLGFFWLTLLSTLFSGCCHKWQYFLFSYGWLVFHCEYVSHLVYPIKEQFGCFHVLATMNNAAMNTGAHISLQCNVFKFFR